MFQQSQTNSYQKYLKRQPLTFYIKNRANNPYSKYQKRPHHLKHNLNANGDCSQKDNQ